MYFPSAKLVILEVPKCGSRTLVRAGKQAYGENYFAGHLTLRKILTRITDYSHERRLNWEVDKVIRIVREPLDRFVSGLNYEAQNKPFSLDYLIDRQFDGKSNTIYNLQGTWCPEDHELVTTYPIHRMSDALADMGYEGGAPWENRSRSIFCKKDVMKHKRYKEILQKYEPDFELWDKYK